MKKNLMEKYRHVISMGLFKNKKNIGKIRQKIINLIN